MESDNFRKWVIAAHLVANQNFSDAAIRNEFLLIGIVFAIVFNLFHANAGHEKHIITNMKVIESRLQLIMGALAAYLSNKSNEKFHPYRKVVLELNSSTNFVYSLTFPNILGNAFLCI